MHNQPAAPKMTSTTTALLQNLATLRAPRDAIMAEIDAINTAPAEVEPCEYRSEEEEPGAAAYDY